MQTLKLPTILYPWRLAADGSCFNGSLPLASLSRLAAVVDCAEGEVMLELGAGVDRQGIRFISGTLCAEVQLTCQRCLEPLLWPLDVAVSLGLVSTEAEIERLPDAYEPLLIAEEGSLTLTHLIEDELLLALPQIARHPDHQPCTAPNETAVAPPTKLLEQRQPFAVLAAMLQNQNKE